MFGTRFRWAPNYCTAHILKKAERKATRHGCKWRFSTTCSRHGIRARAFKTGHKFEHYLAATSGDLMMSRILVIARDNPLSLEIGNTLGKWNFPMEYAAGGADTLHRLRMKSFKVVVTSSESAVDEDLALLEE